MIIIIVNVRHSFKWNAAGIKGEQMYFGTIGKLWCCKSHLLSTGKIFLSTVFIFEKYIPPAAIFSRLLTEKISGILSVIIKTSISQILYFPLDILNCFPKCRNIVGVKRTWILLCTPPQLAELSRSEFDQKSFSHSAYDTFFVTFTTTMPYSTFCKKWDNFWYRKWIEREEIKRKLD